MAVAKRSTTTERRGKYGADGSDKARGVRKEKGKTGGAGRKTKVFSESLGLDHLRHLSNSIASEQADKLQGRINRAKEKRAWQKERNVRKNGGQQQQQQQQQQSTTGEPQQAQGDGNESGKGNAVRGPSDAPLTKSRIRANLIEKQRDKSRMRKEARKAALKTMKEVRNSRRENGNEQQPAATRTKRVSFA